jgi:PAS domain S-box-containing protein
MLGETGYGRIIYCPGNNLSPKLVEKERELEELAEARFVLDLNGVIKSVNQAACRMLNENADALIGMKIGDVFEEEDEKQAEAFLGTWLEALIVAGALSQIEASYVTKDGSRVPVLFSRSTFCNDDGEACGIVCVAKNIAGLTE